jgi:hypothetical protein
MDELKDVCFFVYANEKLKLKKELVYIKVLQQIEILCSATLSMMTIYLDEKTLRQLITYMQQQQHANHFSGIGVHRSFSQ